MDPVTTKDDLQPNSTLERYDAHIQENYGDNYPIIFYNPNIHCQEKKALKDFLEEDKSFHLFGDFKQAFEFAQSLGRGFILIVPLDSEEQPSLESFRSMENLLSYEMFDFEEEVLFKDLFHEVSDDSLKSLKLKAFQFITSLDFVNEAFVKEDEEEVMILRSVKEMAKEFRKEPDVIWYDPCLSSENKEALTKEVSIEERHIYTDFGELCQRIYDKSSPPYYLIMAGGDEAKKVTNDIFNLKRGLLYLYIYSDDPELVKAPEQSLKIVVEKSLVELVPKIIGSIRAKSNIKFDLPAFAPRFDASDKSHKYNLHYYLKHFVNFGNRKQAKEDFIKLAKRTYTDKKIFDFEQEYDDYNKDEIFRWYSVDAPVYKVVNNCLRIASSDSILYCRYILQDLERAIREEYQDRSRLYNGAVFRGAPVSGDEWEKLKNNLGKEIEMYGFLSTSVKREVGKEFAEKNLKQKIFITVIIPPLPLPELNEQGFANISKTSKFEEEAEILFNVRSEFRILEAKENAKIECLGGKNIECRHLVLLYEPRLVKKYLTKTESFITVELKLPSKIKCALCQSTHKLFGFNQEGAQIRCISCLGNDQIPKNTPLLVISSEENTEQKKEIAKKFKGKILPYNDNVDFPYYGYKCHSCQEMGKKTYYKWIDSKTEMIYNQCFDCFLSEREIEADILLAETSPYVLWQEHQTELEVADSDYQAELSKTAQDKTPGEVYMEVQEYDRCIAHEKKVLSCSSRKRGREMRKLKSLSTIATSNEKEGNHQEALKYFLKVLEISRAFYGDGHPETATTYGNLALVYQILGSDEEALELHKKALDIREKFYREEHREIAISYNNIALVYQEKRDYNKALEFSSKALAITKNLYGNEHPETATSYNNLASVYQEMGDYQKALEYFKKSLKIIKAIYGKQNPKTATSYNNIGSVYQRWEKHQQALKYFEKALDIREKIHRSDHSEIAKLYNNLAAVFESRGENEEALSYLQKALEITESSDDMSQLTATLSNSIAKVYHNLGQSEKAVEYLKKALEIRKTLHGEKHPDTAASYTNLGLIYNAQGQHEIALGYHQNALDIETLDGDHRLQTAALYMSLALTYEMLVQPQKALEYRQKALDLNKSFMENPTSRL